MWRISVNSSVHTSLDKEISLQETPFHPRQRDLSPRNSFPSSTKRSFGYSMRNHRITTRSSTPNKNLDCLHEIDRKPSSSKPKKYRQRNPKTSVRNPSIPTVEIISSDDDEVYIVKVKEVIRIDSPKEEDELSQPCICYPTAQINPPEERFCGICMENKPIPDLLEISKCDHWFCYECVGSYIESKLEENITIIKCPEPECSTGILEPQFCRKFVQTEVFDRWGKSLCESSISEASKFYCPFRDCSALLIFEGEKDMADAECPHCYRLFCAKCRVPWHAGINCEDFQKLPEEERGREDRMLIEFAKKSKWQRCLSCKFFVEKVQGCMFIKCRCGYAFCYGCGKEMTTDHYCAMCRR